MNVCKGNMLMMRRFDYGKCHDNAFLMNELQDLSYLVQSWVPWAVRAYYKHQFRLAPHNRGSLTLEMTAQLAEIHPPTTANQMFYLFKSCSKQHDNPAFWHKVHIHTFSLAMTYTWMTYVHSRKWSRC
jgi:hypothetical protein